MPEPSTGFTNPVIPGFHPDPSVCRVGDDYLLAVSSFTYFPGVPIFRSSDLVTWTQIGNALDRPSQLDLHGTETFPSGGIFAPTLRFHAGRFWMITTVFTGADAVNFFVTADDPAGPWSEPVRVDVFGIDPDIAWDEQSNCWVHTSAGAIHRFRIDDESGAVLEGPEVTWSGIGLQFPEAPHLIRRGEWWYLLIAEGGTERGHAVSIARGPSPTGPWESCPSNPIVSHRSTDKPIQSTGHADLVEAPDGSWWMVLLATRPQGMTPMFHVLGRETFLLPVDWVDGWPVPHELAIDMPERPSVASEPARSPTSRDEFDGPLGPQWVSVRGPLGDAASLDERPGWLTLRGASTTLDDPWPVFLGRRQQHIRCRARTVVDVADAHEAGLAIRIDNAHHYEVSVTGGEAVVRATIGPVSTIVARTPVPPGPVVLRVETRDDPSAMAMAPDVVHLGVERDHGTFHELAALDGRYLSTEVASGFTGRVIGLYAVGGAASFDWFELGALTAAG